MTPGQYQPGSQDSVPGSEKFHRPIGRIFGQQVQRPGGDVERLRDRWSGKLVMKGVMTAQDAMTARDIGVDAAFVSNHGGRRFDAQPSTARALEDVAAAVGGDLEILVDGGIRRGSDIVKLTGLGATACLIGRPAVYGLVSNGQAGVAAVLDILADEAASALAFTGATSLGQLQNRIGCTETHPLNICAPDSAFWGQLVMSLEVSRAQARLAKMAM